MSDKIFVLAVSFEHNITWSGFLNATLSVTEIFRQMADRADVAPEEIDEIFTFNEAFEDQFVPGEIDLR